jgi:hypothetical protein
MCIAVNRDHNVIAAVFAVAANHAGNPPDRRVIEQRPLDQPLNRFDHVIATTDVREFIKEQNWPRDARLSAQVGKFSLHK